MRSTGEGSELHDHPDSAERRAGGGAGEAGTARAGVRRRPGPDPEGRRARGGAGRDAAIGSDRRLLDPTGLARKLDVTERHVRRLVAERRIPFLKVGRFVRFDPADIDAWLTQAKVEPRADTAWGQYLGRRPRG